MARSQVVIAPPLLGKFESLLLDNRDLAGLARCLPPGIGEKAKDEQPERRRPSNLLSLNTGDLGNSIGGIVGGGGGGGGSGPFSPLGSPGGRSVFSFGSSTTIGEDEVRA